MTTPTCNLFLIVKQQTWTEACRLMPSLLHERWSCFAIEWWPDFVRSPRRPCDVSFKLGLECLALGLLPRQCCSSIRTLSVPKPTRANRHTIEITTFNVSPHFIYLFFFRSTPRMGENRGPSLRRLLCGVSFLAGPMSHFSFHWFPVLTVFHLLYVVSPTCQSHKQEDSVWEPRGGGAAQENPGAAAAAAAAASRRWAVYSRFVSCRDAAPFLSFFMSLCVTFFGCVSCLTRFGPGC